MTTPFDYINSINHTKKDLMKDPAEENGYVPFITNKTLSYFPDTIMYANEMNIRHQADNKLQFHYLLNSVRTAKRFSKWLKKDSSEIDAIRQYYGYSTEKAMQAARILSQEQISLIRKKLTQGVGDEFNREND
jgi:hypothetical protein